MRYFQNILVLALFSLSAVFFTEITASFVVLSLSALILVCSCYFLNFRSLRLLICCAFLTGALFFPACFYFYPAVFYLLFKDHFPIPAVLGTLYFLYHAAVSKMPSFLILFSCLFFAVSYILQKNEEEYQTLLLRLHNTRDDSQERELLLAEKNQSLLEKQDFEIYTATLKERNRIAREIHDNVGHVLSRSILLTGALKTMNTQEILSPMLDNLDGSLNSAMNSIRTSVHDLHDDAVNLEESIYEMAKDFTFCPVTLTYDMGRNLPKNIKYCFLSITKEAFSNIIKHSNATNVTVLMREHPALYQLCIEDNGTIKPDPVSKSRSGMGLSNMKERAISLNGTFQIIQEHGFKIFITIPKNEKTEESAYEYYNYR